MKFARAALFPVLCFLAWTAYGQELVVVSSANFREGPVAPDSIVTAFGADLAGSQPSEVPLPLASELVGTSVRVTDSTGAQYLSGLYFVSPFQINFVVPVDAALGPAVVSVLRDGEEVASGAVVIEDVAPQFYPIGPNLGAGAMFRIAADGSQSTEQLFEVINGEVRAKRFTMPDGDQLFLVLLGTGYRWSETTLMRIGSAFLESNAVPTIFHGELGGFPGIDQVISNALPRRLEDFGGGLRDVRLYATAPDSESARESNIVKVAFAPNPDAPVLTRADVSGAQRSDGGVRIAWSIDFQDRDSDLGPLRFHLLLTADAGFCLTRLEDGGVPGQTSGTFAGQVNSNSGQDLGEIQRADVSLRDAAGHNSAFFGAEISGNASWRVPCTFFISRFDSPSISLQGLPSEVLDEVQDFISNQQEGY